MIDIRAKQSPQTHQNSKTKTQKTHTKEPLHESRKSWQTRLQRKYSIVVKTKTNQKKQKKN